MRAGSTRPFLCSVVSSREELNVDTERFMDIIANGTFSKH